MQRLRIWDKLLSSSDLGDPAAAATSVSGASVCNRLLRLVSDGNLDIFVDTILEAYGDQGVEEYFWRLGMMRKWGGFDSLAEDIGEGMQGVWLEILQVIGPERTAKAILAHVSAQWGDLPRRPYVSELREAKLINRWWREVDKLVKCAASTDDIDLLEAALLVAKRSDCTGPFENEVIQDVVFGKLAEIRGFFAHAGHSYRRACDSVCFGDHLAEFLLKKSEECLAKAGEGSIGTSSEEEAK